MHDAAHCWGVTLRSHSDCILVSQTAAQWLLMPVAAVMVLEFATIRRLGFAIARCFGRGFRLF